MSDHRRLAPALTYTDAGIVLAEDSRPDRQRVLDHERLRARGAMLAARMGHDQSVPPFMARTYEGDCGYDLTTTEEAVLSPGSTADIACGVAVALPPYTFGWITGRSSTWTRWGLQVMGGIIDEGWRGELFTLVYRPPVYPETRALELIVPAGTRLAQLIVLPNLSAQVEIFRVRPEDLPGSDRGTSGFGSTG